MMPQLGHHHRVVGIFGRLQRVIEINLLMPTLISVRLLMCSYGARTGGCGLVVGVLALNDVYRGPILVYHHLCPIALFVILIGAFTFPGVAF